MSSGDQRSRGRDYFKPEVDPPGTSRLFIAVPVGEDVRDPVARLMQSVAAGPIDERGPGRPRWVRIENLHLTMRFLGATPDVRQPELADAVARVAGDVAPFQVTLAGGGAFPSPHYPRVLWIGIGEGAPALASVAARVNVELQRLGWATDDRPLQAHLTLARTDGVQGAAEAARRLIEAARDVRLSWQADRLILYKSHLGRGPTDYEIVAESNFGGG
jgi:2'-5' RNA ligase